MKTQRFRDYRCLRAGGFMPALAASLAALVVVVPPGGLATAGGVGGVDGVGSAWWGALGPAAAWATPVLIDFDDLPGMPPPYIPGMPVPPQYIVNDEYADLGVLFNSTGGGIAISAPGTPVSPPNVAAPTGPGPTLSFTEPTYASIWVA